MPGGKVPTSLTVDGRLLTGAFATTELRGGRLFVPVVSIAQALGDTVQVNAAQRRVEVRRGTGVLADFDAALGQVRENGVPTLQATVAGEVSFPPDPNALMLPVEIVAALLNAEIVADPALGTVRVTRDLQQVSVGDGGAHGLGELYSLEYGYNLTAAQRGAYSQNLQTSAAGRVVDGRFGLNGSFSGGAQGSFLDFRHGLFTLERPKGQRLMFGDLSTGGDLSFLTTSMRGGWWRQPVAGVDFTTFAGKLRSGAAPAPDLLGVRPDLRFDTSVVGSYLTLGRERGAADTAQLTSSTGGMYYRGPEREGGLLSTSLRYLTERHQFRMDLGGGTFRGGLDGVVTGAERPQGSSLLLEVSESLTPVDSLSLNAGFTHVGERFVGPQAAGFLRPMNQYAGGVSWTPVTGLSMATAGRYIERLDQPGTPFDRDLTASLSVAPGSRWPTLLVAHSQGLQSELGRTEYTLLNLTKSFELGDFYSNLTRARTGAEPLQLNLTVGGSRRFQTATLRAYQSVGSGRGLGGGVDLSTPRFFSDRVSVGAGVGYSRSQGLWSTSARVLMGVLLPARQRLQVSFQQSGSSSQAYLELAGPLFQARGAERASQRSLESLQTMGSTSGRIYQDVDMDGRYDPKVDRPMKGVEVRIDGNNSLYTDENGQYRLSALPAGQHVVYLNLLTVRADLSLLSGAEQNVLLLPDRDVTVDFRLIRTGRASGLVWLDANANGAFDEGEEPLGDVRVLAGNRDTLTNGHGEFLFGDLPQGQHTLVLDEKTLPAEVLREGGTATITVTPPQETRDVLMPVLARPTEVDVQEF